MKLLNNTCLRSDLSAQLLSKLNNFSLLKETMYNYNKSVLSPYDPTKLAIRSILRLVSFDDVVHFIDEEKMVTFIDFHCGITFLPGIPTKFRQINRERNQISRSCEKTQCIPSNDQHTCSVDKQHNSITFLYPYILWDLVPAALISLNHTNDTNSIFNQYTQLKTQQPRTDSYPVFFSLQTVDKKRKRLRVSFAFFHRNYLPDGRMNETVAEVEELSDLWKPGALNGTPPFVMNCNCI